MSQPKGIALGEYCRVHSAPARFIGNGQGVYVSSQSGYELMVGPCDIATGNEDQFPHADNYEVDVLALAVTRTPEFLRWVREMCNRARKEKLPRSWVA